MLKFQKNSRLVVAFVGAASLLLSATGCGSNDSTKPAASSSSASQATKLNVTVGIYPLEFLVSSIGGDKVSVTNLTPPGGEPHGLELSPKQVAEISKADLVVYQPEMQNALDEAIKTGAPKNLLDLTAPAEINRPFAEAALTLEKKEHEGEEHEHEEKEHEGEEHSHEHGSIDPHFWLDPQRMMKAADAVQQQLATIDPDNATVYQENNASLQKELQQLDSTYSEKLASCSEKTLVTAHSAFGYLADRFGLKQVGIAGLSPDDEPSAGNLAKLTDFVKTNKVSTIYTEAQESSKLAETLASETGATVALLNPIGTKPNTNYLDEMQANLDTLTKNQKCQ